MSEETRNFFDAVGQRYGDGFAHDPGLVDFVTRALGYLSDLPSRRVLDVGCGTGAPVSLTAASAGCSVTGIDLSPVMVSIAQKAVPAGRFLVRNMLEYEPDERPDAIFATFSHFQIATAQMYELYAKFGRWVKPGGFLFIGTMAADDYPAGSFIPDEPGGDIGQVGNRFMGRYASALFLTKAGWKNLLDRNGFEILETNMVPFQPPEEAQCDMEPHYYLACRKIAS